MFKKIPYNYRPLRLAFSQLESLIKSLGWSSTMVENKDFPYNTLHWLLRPNSDNHVNSNEMKKFLYACGYYDIEIDYQNKEIRVNI